MQEPGYNLDKIKFSTDKPTFEKAVALYENGKVTQFKDNLYSYSAVVIGTEPYRVLVDARQYDSGHCTCYFGQNDTLCKHMVSLAIYAVKDGKPLTAKDKKAVYRPSCSGRLGTLDMNELSLTKKAVTSALKYIKPYQGPSRIWFAYQNSLEEGCNRLSAIVFGLPVSFQTTELLVDLLLRLDKKLCTGGVDDSDGTVGNFVEEVVEVLQEFAKLDPSCVGAFDKLRDKETSFGWEESLFEN